MAKYRAFNKKTGAYASPEIPNVLAPVALTSVSVTSGSNIVTVASTTGVFPFMGLSIPNLPLGSFVLAIKSSTEIVAAAPLLSTSTGEWTVTAANANATASGSSMTGHAHGFNPVPIPEAIADSEMWRNQFSPTYKNAAADITIGSGLTDYASFAGLTGGYVVTPDTALSFADVNGTKKLVVSSASSLKMITSDEFAVKPYRTKSKWRHVHCLVCTAGDVVTIPASPDIAIVRIGADS